jgi:hypothetical protein
MNGWLCKLRKGIRTMRALVTISVALTVVFALTVPASATVFQDDFNADTVGSVEGQAANTGQIWGNGPWGGSALDVGLAYGQSGTMGVGSTGATPGYTDSWVDIGTSTSSGVYTLAADIVNTAATGGERTVYLLNAAQNRDVSIGWTGGNIVFEGAYAGHAPVPTGFSTGSIKIQLTFDIDASTGSVRWWDNADPLNASTSGTVDLGAFTGTAGGYDGLSKILVFTTVTTCGFDNISLSAGGPVDPSPSVPEPSTLALLVSGLVGLLCYAWRKRK